MHNTTVQMRRTASGTVVLLLALVLCGPIPARAFLRIFDLNMQFRYDLWEWKNQGEDAKVKGDFSVNYGLQLRRPLLPGSSLRTDLTVATNASNDANGSQANNGMSFNLNATRPTYTLVSRINYNNFHSNTNSVIPISSSGTTSSYYGGLLLRKSAYPQVNLQFQRNVTSAESFGTRSSTATDSWLMSGRYDWKYFRFTYDQTMRSLAGAADTDTVTQRGALTMDYPLLSGLKLSGELSRYAIDAGSSTSTEVDRRLLRLSATPTRAISANLDYVTQSNILQGRTGTNTVDSNSLSLNVRSEIRPGLAMDYTERHQEQEGISLGRTTQLSTRNRRVGVSARLTDDIFLSGGLSQTDHTVSGLTATSQQQDALQLSLQTSLRPTTDVSLNYGSDSTDSTQSDHVDSTYAGISLRDRTSSTLSLGAAYRWTNQQQQSLTGTPVSHVIQSVDLDALWQPSSTASLNTRLSYQTNSTGDYHSVQPSVNLRWRIDPRTNLGFSYNLARTAQGSSALTIPLDQQNTGSALNLTHSFRDGTSLNLSYDYQQTNLGTLEWQRRLQMYYNFRL